MRPQEQGTIVLASQQTCAWCCSKHIYVDGMSKSSNNNGFTCNDLIQIGMNVISTEPEHTSNEQVRIASSYEVFQVSSCVPGNRLTWRNGEPAC
jgi:hypothetical protein